MTIARRPRITVGVPVFNGADHVAETLAALQAQTFRDLEVLISIDGGDEASAAACRPFLDDPRITLTERRARLDWAGNLNWLLRHAGSDLFCFLQHDDLIEPTYFEALNAALERNPAAVVAYSDVSWFEGHSGTVWQDSLTGTPNERFRRHLELFGWIPLRGLVRLEAVRRIGVLRLTEYRCCLEEIVWLAKLAAAGDNIRVPETLYRKRFHAGAIHGKFHAWPSEQRMNAWVVAFSGLAGAIPLAASSITERAALVDALLERMLVETPGRWAFFETGHLTPSQRRDLVVHWAHRIVVDGEVRLTDLMGEAWVSRLNTSLAALQLEPFGPQEARERLPDL